MAGGTLIGNLFVDLVARTASFEKGMARAKSTLAATAARMKRLGSSMTRLGKSLSLRVTLPVVLFAKSTLTAAGDFEAAMKIVEAKSKASGKELDALRQRALEMGRTTKFTATEAAQGLVILTRAGLGAKKAFDLLPVVLNLAAASGRDMASSAGTLITTMNQFKLGTEDAAHVADVLVKAANSADQTVEDLSEGMKFAGVVAKDFNISLEDTITAVTVMAKAGIKGTMAGRTMRQAILKIVNPSKEAAAVFKTLGVRVFNASGNFRGFITIMGELAAAGIAPAEALRIFQARGAGVIKVLREGGPALQNMSRDLKNTVGNAATEARKRLEGFNGAMLRLKAAFVNLQIAIGDSGILNFFTKMVEGLRNFIVNVTDINPKIFLWVTGLALLAAAMGPLLIIMGQLIIAGGFMVSGLAAITAAMGISLVPLAVFAAKTALIAVGAVVAALAIVALAKAIKNNLAAVLLGPLGPKIVAKMKGIGEELKKLAAEDGEDVASKFIKGVSKINPQMAGVAAKAKAQFSKGLDAIKKDTKTWKQNVIDQFRRMSNVLVGHSIIPDMVDDIEAQFKRMGGVMSKGAKFAADNVLGILVAAGPSIVNSVGDTATKALKKFTDLFKEKKKGSPVFPGANKEDAMLADMQRLYSDMAAKKDVDRAKKTLLILGDAGKQIGKALTTSLGKALDDFVEKGKFSMTSFRNFAKEALQDVAKGFLKSAFLGPRGGGGGGLLGALGGLFGFRKGGSFTVAGAGGADSQLVAFKATPGEHVSVRRPGQRDTGGGVTVIQNFALGVAQTVRAELAALRPQMAAGFAADLADRRLRGGNFSRAMTGGA